MTSPQISPAPPQVLVFAASDPSAGAGIQADLLTLASLGCHALTAVTALTVQDTVGVQSVHPTTPEILEQQARTILEDMPVVAFKIGLLGSVENVLADLDPMAPTLENLHVQIISRVTTSDGEIGIGGFEQLVIGPYAPWGLKGYDDAG